MFSQNYLQSASVIRFRIGCGQDRSQQAFVGGGEGFNKIFLAHKFEN